MKYLPYVLLPCALLLFANSGCRKDKHFCTEVSTSYGGSIGEVSFTLPNGVAYSGTGALPFPLEIGNHRGSFQSVITKQTTTATGTEVELLHYYNDEKGNTFWTKDRATLTPLDTTFTRFQVYDEITVLDGTGDFACATGLLSNRGLADFAAGSLQINLTGRVCGGCD